MGWYSTASVLALAAASCLANSCATASSMTPGRANTRGKSIRNTGYVVVASRSDRQVLATTRMTNLPNSRTHTRRGEAVCSTHTAVLQFVAYTVGRYSNTDNSSSQCRSVMRVVDLLAPAPAPAPAPPLRFSFFFENVFWMHSSVCNSQLKLHALVCLWLRCCTMQLQTPILVGLAQGEKLASTDTQQQYHSSIQF